MAPPSSIEKEETRKFIDKSKPPKRPFSIRFSIEILRFVSLSSLIMVLAVGMFISKRYIFFPDEDTTSRTLEQDTATGLRGVEQDLIIDGVEEERQLLSLFGQPLTPYRDYKDSRIYETFGFLHICSFIDYHPAKEVASILLPLVFVPMILFIILDHCRIRVSYGNKLIPKGLYTYSKWTSPIAVICTSMIHLWFVNDPDKDFPEGYGFEAHYYPYVAFQVALIIIAIQQVWYHTETGNIPFNVSPRGARLYLKGVIFITVLSQVSVLSILHGTPLFDSAKGGEEGTWERTTFNVISKIYLGVALVVPILCSFWEFFLSKEPSKYTKFTIELE